MYACSSESQHYWKKMKNTLYLYILNQWFRNEYPENVHFDPEKSFVEICQLGDYYNSLVTKNLLTFVDKVVIIDSSSERTFHQPALLLKATFEVITQPLLEYIQWLGAH